MLAVSSAHRLLLAAVLVFPTRPAGRLVFS